MRAASGERRAESGERRAASGAVDRVKEDAAMSAARAASSYCSGSAALRRPGHGAAAARTEPLPRPTPRPQVIAQNCVMDGDGDSDDDSSSYVRSRRRQPAAGSPPRARRGARATRRCARPAGTDEAGSRKALAADERADARELLDGRAVQGGGVGGRGGQDPESIDNQMKPLMSVKELAKGVEYTESMGATWRPPARIRATSEAERQAIRDKWHILVEGEAAAADQVVPRHALPAGGARGARVEGDPCPRRSRSRGSRRSSPAAT